MVKVKQFLGFEQDGQFYNLYDLPDDFVIEGDLDLSNLNLTELPDLSRVEVKGNFCCQFNQLTSLKGAPRKVGEGFYCGDNLLNSLQGAPEEIGNSFECMNNELTSLDGSPKRVGGCFICDFNKLSSMQGIPDMVGGLFYADENILRKYCDYKRDDNDNFYVKLDVLKNSLAYKLEKIINSEKYTRYKALRTIAAENISPQKNVINQKRPATEKEIIKITFGKLIREKTR